MDRQPDFAVANHPIVDYADVGTISNGGVMIPDAIDLSQPLVLLPSSVLDGMDQTFVDEGNREQFVVQQVDEVGRLHTVVLSEAMVIEILAKMNSWVEIRA